MANLSQLQMPSIDTGQLSGKDGKKIKSYLFQIPAMRTRRRAILPKGKTRM